MPIELKNISPLLQGKILDASLKFYIQKLGFQETFRDEDSFTIICRDQRVLMLAREID